MLFTLVLGTMIGAAAVVLLEQWIRGAIADSRPPVRELTPSGAFVSRDRSRAA
jgi:hypothetical protein